MFPGDSENLRAAPRSICIVVPSGLNDVGDIVAYDATLAVALSKDGWNVHLLLCPASERELPAELDQRRITMHFANQIELPATAALDGPNHNELLHQSEVMRHALARLHAKHRFDVILFADRGGLGFRVVQAKRTGLDFEDVSIVVCRHGASASLRRQKFEWIDSTDQLMLDFCEQYVVENADFQTAVHDSLDRIDWQACCMSQHDEQEKQVRTESKPLVTICVPHFNLGAYLPQSLSSIAKQTYPSVEVIVIDDGSTDRESQHVFEVMKDEFPQFTFHSQSNSGIGATRNKGLELANGNYYLPMDADNIAHPDMIQRFVQAAERNPHVAAMTSYFLAFENDGQLSREEFHYAYRPTGGPHLLSCMKNVYGDGNTLFRTESLRAVGGFETDRDTSFEDWEVFVKLVHGGYAVDVVPDYLFYYRHREAGFSRVTNGYQNHQRVLRQFGGAEQVLAGFHQKLERLENENRDLKRRLQSRRHRFADWLHSLKQSLFTS